MRNVQGVCDVLVIDDPALIKAQQSPSGKPFLRLTFDYGFVVDISTNLAEMIGGVGAGVRKREEDKRGSN